MKLSQFINANSSFSLPNFWCKFLFFFYVGWFVVFFCHRSTLFSLLRLNFFCFCLQSSPHLIPTATNCSYSCCCCCVVCLSLSYKILSFFLGSLHFINLPFINSTILIPKPHFLFFFFFVLFKQKLFYFISFTCFFLFLVLFTINPPHLCQNT